MTKRYNGGSDVTIIGTIVRDGIFVYERDGENFYEIIVKVSNFEDGYMKNEIGDRVFFPVIISEKILADVQSCQGKRIGINCCLHSYAKKAAHGRSYLDIKIVARYLLSAAEQKDYFLVSLVGYLCKPLIVKKTADGKMIVDTLLSAARDGRSEVSDYIPFIVKNKAAKILKNLSVGDKIAGIGVAIGRKSEEKSEKDETLQIIVSGLKKYPQKSRKKK